MKLQPKRNWLKSDLIKPGDSITILNEGEFVTNARFTYANGEPKKDFVLKVQHNGQECDFTINSGNKKALMSAFGDETKDWIGKSIKIDVTNVMIGGAMKKSIIVQGVQKDAGYEV